jgi:uncharacterized protein
VIVLDATVLVYAVGGKHPLRDPCRRLVDAVADGSLAATTTVEVIQELVHVRPRRRGRPDAARLGPTTASSWPRCSRSRPRICCRPDAVRAL